MILQFREDSKKGLVLTKANQNYQKFYRPNVIGDYFRALREKHGYSIKELAKKMVFKNINKTMAHLEEIESGGYRHLMENYLTELLNFYGIEQEMLSILLKKSSEADRRYSRLVAKHHRVVTDNVPLFLANIDFILSDDRFYFARLQGSYFSAAYVGWYRTEVYLGELLQLWEKGDWIEKCPTCGGDAYLISAAGSVLSGCGGGTVFCTHCEASGHLRKSFGKFYGALREIPRRDLPDGLVAFSVEAVFEYLKELSKG